MRKVFRYQSQQGKSTAATVRTAMLAGVLTLLLSSCSGVSAPPSIFELLHYEPVETLAWNNYMPGTQPRCNASLELRLINRSTDSLFFYEPEGLLVAAPDGPPLRRFPAIMTIENRRIREIDLAPGDSTVIVFRSPDFGLEPIDIEVYPRVRFILRMQSSVDLPLRIGSPVVELFDTQ
ncbi:MAG: hypothetical protein KFH87_01805 [Bacteroidetes bacterium]|nr:hypothetical protein [Bacteroidota bacterium]